MEKGERGVPKIKIYCGPPLKCHLMKQLHKLDFHLPLGNEVKLNKSPELDVNFWCIRTCILDPAKASSSTGILNLPLNKIDQHKEPAKYFISGFDII